MVIFEGERRNGNNAGPLCESSAFHPRLPSRGHIGRSTPAKKTDNCYYHSVERLVRLDKWINVELQGNRSRGFDSEGEDIDFWLLLYLKASTRCLNYKQRT
ncbi:hypothetical protein KQX54_020876 [Cotesia glomerata]|uniref:Uncharacterized protein n=1 Tax=Cotesia glomerata TaxID=32391 RepID=A0AAV7IIQ9_COTGL|nr:hypothetical protein KQX54_020876 [Cotesia glomerata]